MNNALIIGVFSAVATGAAIGLQASLGSRIGSLISPFRTGLWMNLIGGAIAGVIILIFVRVQGGGSWSLSGSAQPMLIVAGALGIAIIMGVSFSLAQIGVAAGLGALLLGQMLVGLIVDTLGWGSIQAVPLDMRRALGLAVMALAIFMLLPRE